MDFYVVLDENNAPIFCASDRDACHEHINDAINEHEDPYAKQWVVRRGTLTTGEDLGAGNCNVCGDPVRYGERHSQCGAAVMRAEKEAGHFRNAVVRCAQFGCQICERVRGEQT